MNSRLQTYLKEMGIFDGETVHGGCAVTLISTGTDSCAGIMDHVGWRCKGSFERY